ncbi:MAG: choice-of-anchor Q domain-containing protein [Acidimicrobiia bacterium]
MGFAVALLSAGAVSVGGWTAPAGATTTTVTNTLDDGLETSLRAVLEAAGSGDVIELVPGATYQLTRCVESGDAGSQVTGSIGELSVFEAVTINGNGATIEQTCPSWRVIHTQADFTVNDLTITGGTSTRGGGGGIRVDSEFMSADAPSAQQTGYQLVIRNSSIVGNCTSSNGGGFKMNVEGEVTIINSTIANNASSSVGGGFSHSHTGDVLMVNSTVTGNTSDDHAGVDVRGGNFTALYSDIVANTPGTPSGDCGVDPVSLEADDEPVSGAGIAAANVYVNPEFDFFAFGTVVAEPGEAANCSAETSSLGYNFADDETCGFTDPTDKQGTGSGFDPMLGALASNGGPAQTLLPQTGSPLIDAIPQASCGAADVEAGFAITTDQRGFVRPDVVNQKCDIGSVEVQTEVPPVIQPTFTG